MEEQMVERMEALTQYYETHNEDARLSFKHGMIHNVIAQNKIDLESFKLSSIPEDVFQLYRREDIDSLMRGFPCKRLHYVGTDMLTHMMRACVDGMDDATFALYMQYHLHICERPDMVGITNHILDIFRKESKNDIGGKKDNA